MCGITVMLAVFWSWMAVTTLFAYNMDYSVSRFVMTSKILLLVFVTMALLTSRLRVISLLWVMVISIGIYGVKGGLFTILTGGGERVWGPIGTFIGGNNEIGLALNMTLPLIRYLQLHTPAKLVRLGLGVTLGLTVAAILGTQSRGALLGLIVTGLWLILKSNKRLPVLALVLVGAIGAIALMPQTWHSRMDTIDSYETDASALGRINAWWAAWYLAQDNFFGAGIGALTTPATMRKYAPNPNDYHDVHSIYFQVLADHGFVGLGLYLALAITSLVTVRSIVAKTRADPRLRWMTDLAAMINVSLISFAASGAFLGLAYFDFMLTQLAIVVALQRLIMQYDVEGIPEETGALVATQGGAALAPGKRGFGIGRRIADWYRAL